MTSILLINPNISARTTQMMLSVARPMAPPDCTIRGCQADRGAAMIVDEAALAVSEEEVVRIGLEQAGSIDAIIVAAFGNPGAGRLRQLLSIPIIGIGEAAIIEAATGGRRFGIATTTPGLVAAIEASVRDLGVAGAFTGVRLPAGDPLALAADPAAQDEALAAAATECVEKDGAESVIIGGGPLSESAARLRRQFHATIVEPVPAAMRQLLQAFTDRDGDRG
jgi:Asp/Glu/hydantoin racemase